MGSKKARNQTRAQDSKVVVGYCHGDRIHPAFMSSYEGVLARDLLMGRRLLGNVASQSSGAHVATGRCRIVRKFLEHPKKPEWLWMVDTDATFPVTILDQLLASADPVERPIVGALAFGVKPETDDQGREVVNECRASVLELFPTLYLFNEAGKTFRLWNYPQNQLVEVHGTGCHCLLIHRSVLEHGCWDTAHPLPWFRSGTTLAGGEVSEDLFFCIEARRAGFRIHVNTAAKTGHVKEVVMDEDAYRRQLEAKGLAAKPVPPVPELVLVVPSRGRPAQAAALAESWRKTTTGRSSLWFAVDDDDDVNAYTVALGTDVQLFAGPRQRPEEWVSDLSADAVEGGARVVAWAADGLRLVDDWEARVIDGADEVDGVGVVHREEPRPKRRRTVLVPSRDEQRCRSTVEQLVAQDAADEIIVAWNGPGSVSFPGVTVLDTHGMGIHEMWNLGLDRGGDVALLNDDLVLEPGCVDALFSALSRSRVAAASANYDGRDGAPLIQVSDICAGRYDGSGGLAGFAFAVSGAWVEETGYRFPTEAKWWYGDNDLVLTVGRSGWRCVIVTAARVHHDHAGGTDWTGEFGEQIRADGEWFASKWMAVPV